MPRYQNISGIILKISRRRPPDLMVTILTPTLGKITVLARGAEKINSRRLGSLQLGNIISAQIYHHQNFNWLSEATPQLQFLEHKKSLVQFNLLFYILEILNHFIAEDQLIDGVYEITTDLITSVNSNNFSRLIQSEIDLIDTLGFGILPEIQNSYDRQDYSATQKLIKNYLESILTKPLESNKLFR